MVSRDVEEDVMIKVTGQQRCRRGCNDKANWSVSRDVEEDVMIKVTSQSAEM